MGAPQTKGTLECQLVLWMRGRQEEETMPLGTQHGGPAPSSATAQCSVAPERNSLAPSLGFGCRLATLSFLSAVTSGMFRGQTGADVLRAFCTRMQGKQLSRGVGESVRT